jgi:hypothetical protein
MKQLSRLALGLVVVATLLFAADITGKWKGALTGADQERPLTFDLTVKAGAVTGTVAGLADHALEVKDGKVTGDAVTFWVQSEYQGQPVKLMYKGQISGNEIHFNISNEEGSWNTDLVAKKS